MAEVEGLPARRVALKALREVDEDGAWSTAAVPKAVEPLVEQRDRAFASHLAYESLRWQGTLDHLLEQHLNRPMADVEPALQRILRLGALQLWHSDVPAHAAVQTSVELAREAVPQRRAKGASGFVNGVLRSLARSLEAGPPRWPQDPRDRTALTTGHPRWIVDELAERLGLARAAAVLAADSDPAGTTLRARDDRDALVEELRAAGVEAEPGAAAPEAVHVTGVDPRTITAVAEGRARPQDEASMLVTHAADVQPGERVLDLCAGPGGKTTHLATLAGPQGEVVAVELHHHRARDVDRAAAAMHLDNVDVRVGDATSPPLADDERFDVVLVDAPCTGLGVGRRRPEVRWRRHQDDVDALATIQRDLLAAAGRWVAPGGRLVYAVCTWTGAETEEVVDAATPDGMVCTSRRQLLPDTDGTDGMFIATFEHAADGATATVARATAAVADADADPTSAPLV